MIPRAGSSQSPLVAKAQTGASSGMLLSFLCLFLFVCVVINGQRPLFLFSVSGPPALLCLSESLLETLPLLLSPTTACDERSHPLDLAPGVLIFFSSHRFPILCHFFFKKRSLPHLPSLVILLPIHKIIFISHATQTYEQNFY